MIWPEWSQCFLLSFIRNTSCKGIILWEVPDKKPVSCFVIGTFFPLQTLNLYAKFKNILFGVCGNNINYVTRQC